VPPQVIVLHEVAHSGHGEGPLKIVCYFCIDNFAWPSGDNVPLEKERPPRPRRRTAVGHEYHTTVPAVRTTVPPWEYAGVLRRVPQMRRQVPMAQERVVRLCADDPAARLHVRTVATLGRPPQRSAEQRRRSTDASAKSTAPRAAAAGRSPPRRGRAATAPLALRVRAFVRSCVRTETWPLRPVGSAAAWTAGTCC
jgi:hypothetical protein